MNGPSAMSTFFVFFFCFSIAF